MCTNNGIPPPMNPRDQNKQMQQNQAAFQPMNYYQPSPYPPNNWRGISPEMQGMQSQQQQPGVYAGYSPGCILDQIRNCPQTSSPIFILPNGVSSYNNPMAQMPPTAPCITPIPTCIPYTIPMPVYQPYDPRNGTKENECKCSSNNNNKLKNTLLQVYEQLDRNTESSLDYHSDSCSENKPNGKNNNNNNNDSDPGLCFKRNCASSIQLQAMVAQLLGIQGLIACAVTRLLLKKIPNSQINETEEEIMQRTTRCMRQMSKDELIKECRAGQDVHRLLSLYLTSPSTPVKIIPILTTAQIKINILKAHLESCINAKIVENQGCGLETSDPLDKCFLETTSDSELRQLLALLREKECEERVNLNFASYSAQRYIAETRVYNVQRKIYQIEQEMDKRRCGNASIPPSGSGYCSPQVSCKLPSAESLTNICVTSPKKLLLKPHVGSPETTYTKSDDDQSSGCSTKTKKKAQCNDRETAEKNNRNLKSESSASKEKCSYKSCSMCLEDKSVKSKIGKKKRCHCEESGECLTD